MFKSVLPHLLSFDVEWVPDPRAAQLLYGLEVTAHNTHDAFRKLWAEAGATPEQPRPWIKTGLCRVVSICGIYREQNQSGDVQLSLITIPTDSGDPEQNNEAAILDRFLKGVGRNHPQLVGFNSLQADVPIIVQRAIVNGLESHGFAERPDKPWEGADYFSTAGDYHVDLSKALAFGKDTPRLHEIATLCGIPGKIDTAGDQVWDLYLKGRRDQIVAYNECDAFTTHLLWARMAHFAGLLSPDAYVREQDAVRTLLTEQAALGKAHLAVYLEKWDGLSRS